MPSVWLAFFGDAIARGTPMAYAALGETVTERAGVVNLGVEGMMLIGAASAVMATVATGNPYIGLVAAAVAGGLFAAVHGVYVIGLRANQIVSGFALTILGMGVSGYWGRAYVGASFEGFSRISLPGLAGLPLVGRVFFSQDVMVYGLVGMAVLIWALFRWTRFGLQITAVGNDPEASFAMGFSVPRTRMAATLIGGALAGIGGAHLSLAYTHVWSENMTGGQGWIAIGLVIVSRWHPLLVLPVAFAFGALLVAHAQLQAAGYSMSPYLLAMLPYLFAIVALLMAKRIKSTDRTPRALLKKFS